jgi:hypothetical protein
MTTNIIYVQIRNALHRLKGGTEAKLQVFLILGLDVDYHSAKCIEEFASESSRIEIVWVRQPAWPM